MSKMTGLIFFLGFAIVGMAIWKLLLVESPFKGYEIVNYKLENKNYRLLVADTPEKQERGLMYFRTLEGIDGMIFTFPKKEKRAFWNKNTFMDLTLYWVNDGKIESKSELPSIEKSNGIVTVSSTTEVDTVIEMPHQR